MNEHDKLRELLPLAASGDLQATEARRVAEHIERCASCRHALDDYALLAGVLRDTPTPQPSSDLIERTCALAEALLPRREWLDRDARIVAPLIAAGWILALATWPLARAAGAWALAGWISGFGGIGEALAAYSLLGLLFACMSAVAVGMRARKTGRTL